MPQFPEFISLLVLVAVIALVGTLFCHTQIGYSLAAFGQNHTFFTHYGISTTYLFVLGIVISNALAGLSGHLVAQTSGLAELNMGLGKALFCITSLILGKQLCNTKIIINTWIPCAGGLAYFTIQQALLKLQFNLTFFTTIQSLITLAILIYRYRSSTKQHITHLGV